MPVLDGRRSPMQQWTPSATSSTWQQQEGQALRKWCCWAALLPSRRVEAIPFCSHPGPEGWGPQDVWWILFSSHIQVKLKPKVDNKLQWRVKVSLLCVRKNFGSPYHILYTHKYFWPSQKPKFLFQMGMLNSPLYPYGQRSEVLYTVYLNTTDIRQVNKQSFNCKALARDGNRSREAPWLC